MIWQIEDSHLSFIQTGLIDLQSFRPRQSPLNQNRMHLDRSFYRRSTILERIELGLDSTRLFVESAQVKYAHVPFARSLRLQHYVGHDFREKVKYGILQVNWTTKKTIQEAIDLIEVNSVGKSLIGVVDVRVND